MAKSIFTTFQVEFILSNYVDFSNKELANSIILKGITITQIQHRGNRLGLKKSSETIFDIWREANSKRLDLWENIELFKQIYPHKTNREIQEMTEYENRTLQAINQMARKLDLRKTPETLFRTNSKGNKGKKRGKEIRKKMSEALMGHKLSQETKDKISESKKGKQKAEKNGNWHGGISFELYGTEFNKELKESIRKLYNYRCQRCLIHQNVLEYRLSVHHIDYNKKNNDTDNLIPLCRRHHSETNNNREYWTRWYRTLVRS